MISFIWTKRNNIGSKVISWATKSQSSHFSVAFDRKVVFQSTFNKGTHLCFFDEFVKKNIIVHELNFDLGLEEEEAVWQRCASMSGATYDFMGALRLGLVTVFKPLLPFLPYKPNHSYYCLEVASALRLNVDLSIVTPDQLFIIAQESMDGSIPKP